MADKVVMHLSEKVMSSDSGEQYIFRFPTPLVLITACIVIAVGYFFDHIVAAVGIWGVYLAAYALAALTVYTALISVLVVIHLVASIKPLRQANHLVGPSSWARAVLVLTSHVMVLLAYIILIGEVVLLFLAIL